MSIRPAPFWTRRRRWLIVGAVGFLALGLAVIARNALFGGMIARSLATALGRELHAEVTIGGIDGSWWRDLSCTTLVIRSPSGSSELMIPRVELTYGLGLFRGDVGAVRSLTAVDIRGTLDLTKTGTTSSTPWRPGAVWPGAFPELRVAGDITVVTAHGPVQLDGCLLTAQGDRVAFTAIQISPPGFEPFPLAVEFNRPDTDTLRLAQPLVLPWGTIQTLALTGTTAGTRLHLLATVLGGDLTATLDGKTWDIGLINADLAAVPTYLTQGLPAYWQPVTGRGDASVQLHQDPTDGAWLGHGRFQSTAARIGGREIKELRGQITLDRGQVTIRELAAEVAGGIQAQAAHLELRQVDGIFRPWSGGMTLALADVRPWADVVGMPASWQPSTPVSLALDFSVLAGAVTVDRFQVSAPGLTVNAAGTWAPPFSHITLTDMRVHSDLGPLIRSIPALAIIPKTLHRWRLPELPGDGWILDASGNAQLGTTGITGAMTALDLALPGAPLHCDPFPFSWSTTGWTVGPVNTRIGDGFAALALSRDTALHGSLMVNGVALDLAGHPAVAEGMVTVDDHQVTITRMAVHGADLGELNAHGHWPTTITDPGEIMITGTCQDLAKAWPGGPLASGTLGGELAIRGNLNDLQGDLSVILENYRLRPVEGVPAAMADAHQRLSGKLHGDLTPMGASLLGGLRLGDRDVLQIDGALQPGSAGWPGGALSGQAVMNSLRLEDFPGLIPVILRMSGQLDGRLELGGTPLKPTWQGNLILADGVVKISPDVPTITDIAGRVHLNDQAMTLEDVHAQVGYAPATLGGTVSWPGRQPHLDLTLRGKNLLLARTPDLRVRADTDVSLRGPVNDVLIAGTVTVIGALWSQPIELMDFQGSGKNPLGGTDRRFILFSLRQNSQFKLRFDLTLKTRDEPLDEGLRLLNNVIDARCSMDLHLGGTGEAPEPNGHITLREGSVSLPFSSLGVSMADLTFSPGDPFHPRIAASASAQVGTHRVDVLVSGEVLAPVVQMSSPGLDDRDCLLLLTVGATAGELTSSSGKVSALSRVGTYLGRQGWRSLRGPGDPDEGPGFLERTTVEIGREISTAGRDTILTETLLTPFGKRISAYLTGERDRYDDYNLGVILRIRFGGASPP